MKKTISILLIFVSIIGILSGCSGVGSGAGANTNEIKFRDISFGTKYGIAMPKLEADLKEQGYNSEPEIEEIKDLNRVVATFPKIKLFDYDNVNIVLFFLKEDNEDINNAKLLFSRYVIDFSNKGKDENELAKECYNYFNKKLTELYGEKTSITLSGYDLEGWKKGNTFCFLDGQLLELGGLSITYGFLNCDEQFENSIKAEEESRTNSANKGL